MFDNFLLLIKVFHIGDELTPMKLVAVEDGCRGIAFFQHSFILGFRSPAPSVVRMSEEGKVLNTLRYDSSGEKLFSRPNYIHVENTSDSTRILVSDSGKDTVYMLDDGLQLLQAFEFPSYGEPRGQAAVGGGQVLVLVVDSGTWTLQLLDLTMGRWRTLLGKEEGLGQPFSLVYNQALRQLYIGCKEDNVKVYTVSE